MKTTILLMLSLLLITGSLTGQTDKFKNADSYIKRDYPFSNNLNNNHQIDSIVNIIQNLDVITVNKSNKSGLNHNHFPKDPLMIRSYLDSQLAEKYPGSSIYYARRPYLNSSPYQKSFIIKPDTSKKYYLIIKNPINQGIIK